MYGKQQNNNYLCIIKNYEGKIMKKMMVIALLLTLGAMGAQAQKYALIDMEYILKNIPAYEMANDQLNSISKQWQNEVESVQQDAQNLYKTYQADLVFLSADMKTKREAEIVAKEQEAQDLKKKYFGTDGELFKKRQSLIRPIQDEIYSAVKEIAEKQGYALVIDRASAMSIIYATPKIDISNDILAKLGYSK
jgi:outer membrane protein